MPTGVFLVDAAHERHVTALLPTDEKSERYACRLRRSLGAEPVAQQIEIAKLPLGKLVAGVAAKLHLDAEAANGDAGDPAFAPAGISER